VYLDSRLWALTAGVRGRIAATVLVGLAAVAAGIARLALLGWLLARVLAGESLAVLAPAVVLTAAALAGRSALDYARTMVAHRTAARVQERLRQMLYVHVTDLGPAHFARARTGDVMLSLVEGVQQLEVYFGQYLPQLFVAAITPLLIFAFVAFVDLPVALMLLGAALVILLAPALWHRWDQRASLARNHAYAAFGADFLDAVQGLSTLKAFGQSGARAQPRGAGPRSFPEHHGGPRHQHPGARDHRRRHRGGRGGRPRARRLARRHRRDVAAGAAGDPDARRGGVPAATRAADPPPPGNAGAVRRAWDLGAPRCDAGGE